MARLTAQLIHAQAQLDLGPWPEIHTRAAKARGADAFFGDVVQGILDVHTDLTTEEEGLVEWENR